MGRKRRIIRGCGVWLDCTHDRQGSSLIVTALVLGYDAYLQVKLAILDLPGINGYVTPELVVR